jgi:hypothetical protein
MLGLKAQEPRCRTANIEYFNVRFRPIADISPVIHDARMSEGDLTVRLRDGNGDAVRIAGVHLDLRFYTQGRFRYSFSLGKTDVHGACHTTIEQLESQLEANQRLFLMDYNTPLAECDTLVGIVAPRAGELVEREAARAKWWPNEPSMSARAANDRVHCQEQKFELNRGGTNVFELICEVSGLA